MAKRKTTAAEKDLAYLKKSVKDFEKQIKWRDAEIKRLKKEIAWHERHHGGRGTGRP